MGVRVDTLAGCANPIILSDLCFTLTMATFEVNTLLEFSFLTSPLILKYFQLKNEETWGVQGLPFHLLSHCQNIRQGQIF